MSVNLTELAELEQLAKSVRKLFRIAYSPA